MDAVLPSLMSVTRLTPGEVKQNPYLQAYSKNKILSSFWKFRAMVYIPKRGSLNSIQVFMTESG